MQCDICFRTGGRKLPFLCATDARNQLYEPRLRHARVLLEKEQLDKEVSALVSRTSIEEVAGPSTETTQRSSTRCDVDKLIAERDASVDRTAQIIAQADELRAKVDEARADIAQRKAILAQRKSSLAIARDGLEAKRTKQLEDIERATKMSLYKWNQKHVMTIQSRAFLCAEVASLYGLQRQKNSETRLDEYSIGGVKIVDLKAMNIASPVQITTSLSHVAHLLVLVSHYLAIRLPAEITLPHADYPLPTISSLTSSYTFTNLPFPGISPPHSSNASPTASRQVQPSLPRPRPLFVTKSLPLLAKEDPATYSSFIEATTLLSYNIAWLCKSQGTNINASHGSNPSNAPSADDLLSLGRNLYNLLTGNRPRPRPPSLASTPNMTPSATPTKARTPSGGTVNGANGKDDRPSFPTPGLGNYSHGSSHTSLNSLAGTELTRSFKLMNPVKLADGLKKHLLNEVASAEWEILDSRDEFEEGQGLGLVADRPRSFSKELNGGRESWATGRRRLMESYALVGGVDEGWSENMVKDSDRGGESGSERARGTSGWTKVKPRQPPSET
jgi:hypothetical protein